MGRDSGSTLVLLSTVLFPACSDARRPTSASEQERYSLGPALVRIGSESDYPLHFVTNAYEDSGGRVFVIQLNTPTVAVFDSGGKFITELGGAGGGPGRFSYPATVGALGDSIWVSDVRLRKLVLYDSALNYVHDVVLSDGVMSPSAHGPGGRVIATSSEGKQTDWSAVDADPPRTLYRQDLGSTVIRFGFNGRGMAVVNPFRDGDLALPKPRDPGLIVLEAGGSEISLLHLAWNGDTLLSRELPVSAQPVTDEWYEHAVARLLREIGRSVPGAGLRDSLMQAMPRPAQTHALTRSMVGSDGTLWFGQSQPGGSRWHAVDLGAGEYLGFVDLPPGQELRVGTREHVWVLEMDQNEVQYLVKRPVTRHS